MPPWMSFSVRSIRRTTWRRLGLIVVAALAALAGALVGSSGGPGESAVAAGERDAEQRRSELARAREIARRLSPSQLAGQRLIAGVPGTHIPDGLHRMIGRGELAGVILFASNFPTRSAGRRLIRQLQNIPRPRHLRVPLLIMIDQEGGLVKRVNGAPNSSAAEMGRRGAAYSRRQGRLTGRNLLNLGVNVNLAPVLDVGRRGGDIAGTDRAFGSTVSKVRATAIPFARGLQSTGVAATAKHFPGLGAVSLNTDFASQTVRLSKRALRRIDEAPYRNFIAAGGELIMLGTAIYPAFSDRPAAFAREIATTELRKRLGFEGVTITDAMGTVAVNEFRAPRQATLAGARAGVDLLLYTDFGATREARRALLRGWGGRGLKRRAFVESAARVLALRRAIGARIRS